MGKAWAEIDTPWLREEHDIGKVGKVSKGKSTKSEMGCEDQTSETVGKGSQTQ